MKNFWKAVCLVLFLISPVNAEVNWLRSPFFNNVGGLNNSADSTAISDNEAADIQNIVFTTGGAIKKRDGFTLINSTATGASVACTGVTYYSPTSGSKFLVSVSDDDKIRKMDYSVGGGPDGTWDDITGSISFNVSNSLASFAVGEDQLLIEDGLNTTAPYVYTGTGNASALGGSPPNCSVIAYHKRHAFCAGNDTNQSTLYHSAIDNVADWTSTTSGNFNVETNDGSIIRALLPGFDALYVFKDFSIWRVTGDDEDTWELQRMVADIGSRSPTSVKLIGNDIFFVSDQGDVYLYDGGVKLRRISAKIDGTLDGANFARFQYSVAENFDDDYYLAISNAGVSQNDTVLLFDTFNLAWTKFTGIKASCISIADGGVGENILVFGNYNGLFYEYPDGENDAGAAITGSYLTKAFLFPQISLNKTLRKMYLYANQEGNFNINIDVKKDFESTGFTDTVNLSGSSSLWGTAVFGTDVYGGQNVIIDSLEPNRTGKFFQFRFYNENADQPFLIRGWELLFEQSDRI